MLCSILDRLAVWVNQGHGHVDCLAGLPYNVRRDGTNDHGGNDRGLFRL